MSCRRRKRTLGDLVAVALVAACLGGAAQAAELYRWNDADGRVVYGDKPPRGARNVTRVDVDTTTTTLPAPAAKAPPAPPAAGAPQAAPPVDLLTQRRMTRARLEGDLAQARARLDLARKNLAEATDMAPDEQQVVQQRLDNSAPAPQDQPADATMPQSAHGGMFGMYPNRMNCTSTKGPGGKTVTICPTIIPNAAYQERIAALEDAVRKAEEDVAAAETAYRRGVD